MMEVTMKILSSFLVLATSTNVMAQYRKAHTNTLQHMPIPFFHDAYLVKI
jgi:hypothetical protein